MNEITLPYRHRIRNSSPGGLKLSVTEAPHKIESLRVSRCPVRIKCQTNQGSQHAHPISVGLLFVRICRL